MHSYLDTCRSYYLVLNFLELDGRRDYYLIFFKLSDCQLSQTDRYSSHCYMLNFLTIVPFNISMPF